MSFESFILIGGKSSRMGEDKFSLVLNGQSFLEIASEKLWHFGKVSVVVSDQTKFKENLPIVKDIYQNRGAAGGIHSALVHSKSIWTLILACDYPFVTAELIEFLINVAKAEIEFDAFAPIQADGKIQPLCAVYKTEACRQILSEMLENESENYSVRDFLNRVKTRYIQFSEIENLANSQHFFFNVNNPEDFISATKLALNNQSKIPVEIVKMTAGDISEILKIQQESNLSPWSFEDYKDEIGREDSFAFVAKNNEKTVGFLVGRLMFEENFAELYNIGIESDFRRLKIGKKLLEKFIKSCSDNHLVKIFLEVRETNYSAVHFYKQQNFVVIGKRKNFYTNPMEDAILMERDV